MVRPRPAVVGRVASRRDDWAMDEAMTEHTPVRVERTGDGGRIAVVTIDRPHARNAVDGPTADLLHRTFVALDSDERVAVAVLAGADGTFCSGADLKAVGEGRGNRVSDDIDDPAPLGCTRLLLDMPVIAAVEGFAVAGGLELALWADLRVAARTATFGVYCRRWGVPLVDGGTVRLPRLIGQSRALDMILTGRSVPADEAYDWGLVNRLVEPGEALPAAIALAEQLAALPQVCLRTDRRSVHEQWGLDLREALANETRLGLIPIAAGETRAGAARFAAGAGRHGTPT